MRAVLERRSYVMDYGAREQKKTRNYFCVCSRARISEKTRSAVIIDLVVAQLCNEVENEP